MTSDNKYVAQLQGMKDNARKGFSNGARSPFGYYTVEDENTKRKKREICKTEADVIRKIFDLFLNGADYQDMGTEQIAEYLNERCIYKRGSSWTRSRIYEILSNRIYTGEYQYNKTNRKSKAVRPESEWIDIPVDPIISDEIFRKAAIRLKENSLKVKSPRIANSRVLLSGLLKCGFCGSSMTARSGKHGRYKYYRCKSGSPRNDVHCACPSLPMNATDENVLRKFADEIFTMKRIRKLITEVKKLFRSKNESGKLEELEKELRGIESQMGNIHDAIASGKIKTATI